jgi:hypothetical protein
MSTKEAILHGNLFSSNEKRRKVVVFFPKHCLRVGWATPRSIKCNVVIDLLVILTVGDV